MKTLKTLVSALALVNCIAPTVGFALKGTTNETQEYSFSQQKKRVKDSHTLPDMDLSSLHQAPSLKTLELS